MSRYASKKLSIGSDSPTILSLVVLLAVIFATWVPAYSATPTIQWKPQKIEITIFPGTSIHSHISFQAKFELDDISFRVIPALSNLIHLDFTELEEVFPAQWYTLPITYDIPSTTIAGNYDGTIQITKGNRRLAQPLPILIHVVEPSASIIPDDISLPSTDRIMSDSEGQKLVVDEIVVMLDFETPNPEEYIMDVAMSTGAIILGAIPETLTYQLQYSVLNLEELEEIRIVLEEFPYVVDASHHYLMNEPITAIPNDTEYDEDNDGDTNEHWDEDNPGGRNWNLEYIEAPTAWDNQTGDSATVVAVIDGDLDENHFDLNDNVASSSGTRHTAYNGHGTHVAGIACAEGNNGMGITGASWSCSLRFYDFGYSPVEAQAAMVNAINEGARIVNMSLQWIDNNQCGTAGTATTLDKVDENNDILGRAILFAEQENIDVLWVFAAGNECRDAQYASPASLTFRFPLNTISVASIDQNGNLSNFSNFGDFVTVAAPGRDIYSTLPQSCDASGTNCTDEYGTMSGTSMAAPLVSGVAALVLSEHPDFTSTQIKQCILAAAESDGTDVPGQDFNVINAPEAVKCEGTVDLPDKVDIVFSIDLTGSMLEEIDRIKNEMGDIIENLESVVSPTSDFRYGVVSYEDYAGDFDSTACGSTYSDTYGTEGTKPGGDAPFRTELALTDNAETVKSKISSLVNGSGADGPQSYGRVFWELGQTDTGDTIGFRDDALKLIINFGDNVPHDMDLNEGVADPPYGTFDTGVDPGRNNTIDCNGDDIDFQDDAIPALVDAEIKLLHIDSSGLSSLTPYWQLWASDTGGAFAAINADGTIPGELNLTELIVDLLQLIE